MAESRPAPPVFGWRGVGVAVAGPDGFADALREHLPPFFVSGVDADVEPVAYLHAEERDGGLHVELPDELSLSGARDAPTLRAVASRLELVLANRLPGLHAVHAGVVAFDGTAILLPGRSLSGKSTLVAALLAAGATYLSDEFALLDAAGLVHAYPRRMTMRTPTGSERVAPTHALPADADPIAVTVIADIRYDPAGWAMDDISPAQAVMALIANGVDVRREPGSAVAAYAAAAESARCVRGTRGDADEAVRLLPRRA